MERLVAAEAGRRLGREAERAVGVEGLLLGRAGGLVVDVGPGAGGPAGEVRRRGARAAPGRRPGRRPRRARWTSSARAAGAGPACGC